MPPAQEPPPELTLEDLLSRTLASSSWVHEQEDGEGTPALSTIDLREEDTELHPALLETQDSEGPCEVAQPTDALPPTAPHEIEGLDVGITQERPRYRLMKRLGQGGMGVVEQLWDQELLRDVAVKRLLPQLRDKSLETQRFLCEARVTSYLEHPNLIPLHDLRRGEDGQLFLSMRFLQGRTLRDQLQQWAAQGLPSPRDIRRRLRLFLQLCNGVAYAHSKGIIHRDLKPENAMIGDFGEVTLMDWGIAMPAPDLPKDRRLRIFGPGFRAGMAGTPLYMPLEQATGEDEFMDHRVDVYALGVMLYEMLTHQAPYPQERYPDLAAVFEDKAHNLPPNFAQDTGHLSSSYKAVLARAMGPLPGMRYDSVQALQRDIERLLEGLTPEAEQASFWLQAGRFYLHRSPAFRHWRFVHVNILGLSSIAVGIAFGATFPQIFPWWLCLIFAALAIPYNVYLFLKVVQPDDEAAEEREA